MLSGFPGKRTDLTRLLSASLEPQRGHSVVLDVVVVGTRHALSLRRPYRSVIKRRIRRIIITVPVTIKTKISIVGPPFKYISVEMQDLASLRRVYPYL